MPSLTAFAKACRTVSGRARRASGVICATVPPVFPASPAGPAAE